jgi:adenosylcobinamide-phosphate synthase
LLVAAAFLLDLLLGDPRRFPHPVVFIGRLISLLEQWLNKEGLADKTLRRRGTLLAATVFASVFVIVWLTVRAAALLHPLAGNTVVVILLFTTLAARSLKDAAKAVEQPLLHGDLPQSRQAVAAIVGRDTANLPEAEVARAAVETVAENTVDGVTAPLFYALLGGAPLAMAYKAVNTMDSMLGYKNRRYLHFGRAAARLDDFANWVPARLTVPVMLLASLMLQFDVRHAWRVMRRDAGKHPSPNSGLAEALTAGALGLTLGGENIYGGQVSNRPLLGDGRAPRAGDIGAATRLMLLTSLLFLMLGLGASCVLAYLGKKVLG